MRSPGWAELYGWQLDRAGGAPLFRQIYAQVRAAALSGALRPGTKLPSSRAMATGLGVARASVVAAYEQLLAEGYVEGRPGSGTFVAAGLTNLPVRRRAARSVKPRPTPAPARAFPEFERTTLQTDPRPFNTGRTLLDARTMETWRKLTHRAVRSLGANDLGYTDPCGLIELRRSLCDYLRAARAVRCEPQQIVITAGTQHALDIAIRVLLAPGDEVWVEDPGYPLTHAQLLMAKARPRPVPVDAHGIVVEAGRRAAPKARAAFVTPSHQFPTGVAMAMARRLELLAWARASGAFVVEDDYTSEFRYSGPPLASLQGLDEDERVIYVGTLNKALFPGLRIGYAVVPPALLPAFASARYLMDRQPPTLHQAVVAELMQQGHFAAHIRRMRQTYREQRDALAATLTRRAGGRLKVEVPDQGMHLVAYLDDGAADTAIEAAAQRAGIVVRAVSRFYRAATPRPGLMLGFSGFPRPLIVPAAARLAALVAG
ncbi:MAG TPA: PLP-dependent aminotransferase family protein [Xanthobacteraceae bacterium]|nr:PLP-dependent aminotransferase family protein [Xanthobacteraceae bacterium]